MSAPSHGDYLARRHFSSLDGFRAICITAVVWHHSQPFVHQVALGRRGFLGVDAFFVLSGFLIVTLLLRERDRTGGISIKQFWARRSLRIFPLYYAIVLGLLALHFVRPGDATQEVGELWPWLVTYTANWVPRESLLAVTWSLCAEEQFYAIWPLIERFAARFVGLALVVTIGLNVAMGLGAFDAFFGARADLEMVNATFAPILFGVVLAHLLHRPKSYAWLARALGGRATPAVLFALTLVLVALPISLDHGLRIAVQLVMAAWLGSMLVRPDHVMARFFDHRLVVRMGVVSYGMYLLHMFVDHGARKLTDPLGDPMGLRFVIVLLGTWFVAELSHRYFESRFLALKSRFSWRHEPKEG